MKLTPTYKEELSARIRETAKSIGGGNELSRRIGLSRTTVESYLKGLTEPQISTLIEIAEKSGVSFDWLVFGEGSIEESKASVFELFESLGATYKPITPAMVEDAVRNLMEYLLEHEQTLEPKSIGKAATLLCEMGLNEGVVTKETVERLMSFKN